MGIAEPMGAGWQPKKRLPDSKWLKFIIDVFIGCGMGIIL